MNGRTMKNRPKTLVLLLLTLLAIAGCAVEDKKPNLLFVLADDQRNDVLSCEGHPIVQTPTNPIETDLWKGYAPLMNEWNIKQFKSNPPNNFITVHRFIQQLKSWIRGIFHWVSDGHLQGYLDEFCFRLNRHLFKELNVE